MSRISAVSIGTDDRVRALIEATQDPKQDNKQALAQFKRKPSKPCKKQKKTQQQNGNPNSSTKRAAATSESVSGRVNSPSQTAPRPAQPSAARSNSAYFQLQSACSTAVAISFFVPIPTRFPIPFSRSAAPATAAATQ